MRRELLEGNGWLAHPYSRAFERGLRDYECALSKGDVVAACALADLVYLGDFHAVPAYQVYAAELLEALARRVPRLLLGIEFVYTRQQGLLDRRQAGSLDDDEFLRRIHFESEWGYAWEGYRGLLDRARELAVEVHALDAPPRGELSTLRRRDEHAARRIVELLERRPDARMLVLFGETHLARAHLPRRVKDGLKAVGLERREIVVLQNPDRVYWSAASRGVALPQAVRIDESRCAVFHTSPLVKYESYRQVLARWTADEPGEEEVDLTPAAHHLIHELLQWLGIRASRRRLKHRAGWTDDLVDVLPEVYAGGTARELLGPILDEHRRSAEEREEARRLLELRGALYDSRSNTLFLRGYLPGPAAGEATRFLRAALTGRLFIAADDFAAEPAAAAYAAAYNEALAYLGSRLIEPASDYLSEDDGAPADAEEFERWLALGRRFETSRASVPPPELRERLGSSRPLRRALARDLGRRLGALLFEGVRSGALGPPELRRLFTRALDARQAVRFTTRLVRGGVRLA